MNRICTLVLCAGLCVSTIVKAQVSGYSFSQSNSAYTPLTSGTANFTSTSDDQSVAVTIPFAFTYNGTSSTNAVISYNGFLVMNSTDGSNYGSSSGAFASGTNNGTIISTSVSGPPTTNNIISGFNLDWGAQSVSKTGNTTSGSAIVTGIATTSDIEPGMAVTGTGIPSGAFVISTTSSTITLSANATATGTSVSLTVASSVITSTLGSSPNRIFVVQFSGIKRFGVTGDLVSFQIRLTETTNAIDVIYSTSTLSSSTSSTAQVGLKGSSNTDFNIRKTSSNWSSTSAGTINSDVCSSTNTIFPVSGLTFSWANASTPVNDNCASPTSLTVNAASTAGTLLSSNNQSGFSERDVWYSFATGCSGNHTITVNSFSGDIDYAVYASNCPASSATSTVGTGLSSVTGSETGTFSLANGTTYYVRVFPKNNSSIPSTFNIAVSTNSGVTTTATTLPAAGLVYPSATNTSLFGFSITTDACSTTPYDFTGVTITKSGTSTTSDISNLQVVYDADGSGTYNGGDVVVSSAPQSLAASMAFTITGQTSLGTGTRKYLVIGDIAAGATPGRTFTGSIANASDVTVSTSASGTASGNTQTIAPSNNLCTSATSLTVGAAATSGTLSGADFTTPFTSNNDVWYSFTASCTGQHSITVSSIASGTVAMQVWASSCPASTSGNLSLASGSASGTSSFTGVYSLTSGTTYYVRVYESVATASTFNIAVASAGGLTLDNTGTPAAGVVYPNTTDNVISGFRLTPDACASGSYDITAVKFTISGLIISADINSFRLVYDADNSGTYNAGDVIVSSTFALASPLNINSFIVSQTGLTGTRRYLLIANIPSGATVDHNITASIAAATDITSTASISGTATCNQQTIAPANDFCGSPTSLTLNTTSSSNSLTNATFTSPFSEKDVWYSFTPACSGTYNFTIGSPTGGTFGIQVFNVSCPPATTTGLQTSTGGSTSGSSAFSGGYSLTSGTTYYVRVYAVSGSPSTFTITAANTVTVNNTGAPAAGYHLQGATNRSISGFTVVPGCTSSYTVSTVKFTTSGTATASDFVASSFKIYKDVNSNNTYDNGTDILVSAAGQSFGTTMTFTLSGSYSASQAFFLVCDISSSATVGRTIIASIADASTDVTLSSPIGAYGSATGNTQTIAGTLATDDYRTQASGNWATASTWQSYNAGTGWITASAAPTSSANSITIQNGHTITIAAAATADELTIQSGGILNQSVGQTFTISNGPSAIDFNILNGGIFVVNGSVPTFSSSATMEVQSGGMVRVDGQTSTAGQNQSDVLAYSSASYPTVIFRTGGIYQWNVSNSVFAAGFTTAGVTYFPNATGEVPIFRVSAAQATKTPGTACVINGKYEHNSGISFGWAGTASKTFRDGFGGAGTITFFPGGGSNFITGTSAVIDGTVTISVNNSSAGVTNNLTVSSGGSVTVSGSPTINIGGTTAGSASGTANLTISSGATWTMSGTPNLNIGNQTSSGIANLNIAGTFTSTSSNAIRMDYFGTNTLNITGTIGAGNTATFTPNNAGLTNIANVTVNSSTSSSVGTLAFTSGFQTMKNFTLTAGTLTLGSNMTVHSSGTFTMTGGILILNGYTLTINGIINNGLATYSGTNTSNLSIGGSGTITGNFNFTSGAQNLGALTMNRTGTTATIGTDLTLNSASTITAGTVANSSGTTLTLGSSLANSGTMNINGTLQMNTGSSVTGTSLTYGSSSTLLYNSTGTFTVGNEWTGNATTAGLGIPQNVTIQNTGTVSMPSTDRGLAGNLTISAGTLALNATSGNLYVAGNWTNNSAFTNNNRTVFFNGSAAQSINGTTAGSFYNLTDNNTTADVTMNQNITVSNTFTVKTSGVMAINGNTLTVNGTVDNTAGNAGTIRGSSTSNLTIGGTSGGSVGTLNFTTGSQTLNNFTMGRTGSGATTVLGTGLSVGGVMDITNAAATVSWGSNTLTLNGTITGSGSLTGSSSSNLTVGGTSGGSVGTLNFTSGSQTLNNFTISRTGSGATAALGTSLTVSGALAISNAAASLSWGSNTLTLNGTISGSGTLTGSSSSNLTVGGTSGSLGTMSFTSGSQTLNTLTMSRTGVGAAAAAVLGSDLTTSSLTLTNGILATGSNLLTWSNAGGTLTAPNIPYTSNNSTYKNSYVCLCDAAGAALSFTSPFNGSIGFRVNNVGSTTTWFPVGVDFTAPNRMNITNTGTTDNFTVVMAKTDIGNTLPNVNRVWYVNEGTTGGSTATMNLFFTKQTTSQYGISQDEVENSFDYTNTLLGQKDYSGNYLNISTNPSTDKIDNSSNTNSTEIYARYTTGVSKDVSGNTNGINNFNRFTIANGLSNDLCVSATGLTVNSSAVSDDLTGATFSSPFTSGNDIWYSFTASCTGTHGITISNIASGTIGIQVFASTCPSSTTGISLASGSASGSSTFTGYYSLTSGTTYYVRVYESVATASTFDIAVTSTGNLNLSNTGTPAAGYIYPNTTNNPISGFTVTPDVCLTSYDITAVKFTISGTATTSDINNFRLVYDADNSGTYNAGDVIVSSGVALSSPLNITVTGETGLSGTRRYLLIADVPSGATTARTITASIAATTDLTTSTTVVGTATCNQQIIGAGNNLCSAATALTVNAGATAGDMTGATFSSPFSSGNDVWYTFTASCTGTHPVTISSIASGTLGVQVFASTCPSSTTGISLASGSASGSSTFTGNYSLTSGTVYYVRVYTVSGTPSTFNIAVTSTGNLNLSNTGAPAAGYIYPNTTNNPISGFTVTPDACLTSYDLTSVKFTLSGLIITADINNFRLIYDADNSGTYNGGDVLVSASYSLASPSLTVTITGETGLSGTRRYLLIADVPNTATVDHYLTYSVAAATDLVASATVVGTATCNQQIIGPANDLCGTPTALTLNTTLSSQSMTNATITSPFAEKDMWYSFTPTCTGTYNITIGSIAAGTIGIQVFNTSCPPTTTSGLQTSTGGSTSGTSSFSGGYSLTSGTTYYIRVYAVSGSPTTFSITAANTVTVNNTGAPAAGNILAGATNVAVSGFTVVPGCTSSYTINTVKFTTSGTAVAADFTASSFKIYKDVNSNNTYDNGTDVLVSAAGQTFASTMTFTLSGSYSASQAFFLVCDVAGTATAGRTITASIVAANTDVTLTSPIGAYGSATGNTQTIVGTLATDDYRSRVTGNWATASTWESYNAGTGWITASAAPTNAANSITIQSGHTVTIAAAATAQELTVQSGGILNQSVGQTFSISNGPSAIDFNILNGGIFVVNGSVPTFSSSATMEVQSGGIVRVDGQTGTAGQNQSDVLAYSSASYPTVIFRTGSIYQWNVSNSVFAAGFTTAGVTYFPNATGEVPIFRVSAAQATKTPGTACVINGKYEHNSGISFGWAGSASKTFRDGFGGAGTITLFPGGGSNFITGSAAVIDGTVTIHVNNSTAGVTNNLTVSSGANVTVSGSPTINIGGTTAGSASGTANLTISSGATWTMSGTPNLNIGNQTSSGIANLNIAGTFTSTSSNAIRMDYFGTNTLNITGTIGAGNTATFTTNNAGLTNIANVTINSSTSSSVGTLTLTSGFQTVKNFTLTAGSVTLGSNITMHSSGTHTMTAGVLDMNGKTVTINGIIVNSAGTYTGSTTSNLSIGGSGSITGAFNFTTGAQNLGALTMNRTAITATIGTDLTLNSASTITAGTVANSSSTTLALNSSLANSGTLSIAGTLQMNTGSSVSGTAPTYSSSSTLLYNPTGTFNVSNEWTGNATTAGLGVPQTVTVQNTGTVNMPSTDRGMAGNLNINTGTLALNATSGNLYVAGNWTRVSTATFTPNNRTVFFNGTAAQSINVSGGGTETFAGLTNSNTSADVTMNNDVTVSSVFTPNTSSVLAINGNTLTLNGTISGAGTLRGSSSSNVTVGGTSGGSVGTINFTSGAQTLNNLTISRTGSGATAVLGTNLTVSGALAISNAAASMSWGSNTLTLNGTISGSGTLTGSSSSNLTVGGTSGSLGTMSFTSGSQTLNTLTMSRTGVGAAAAAVLGSDLTTSSLTLTNGILATGSNLLTWSNAGGTLTAPNIPYTANNTSYKNSYVCLCDAVGAALSFTSPFDGSIGLRINNVGSSTVWFPVGVDFTAPNRMNITNTGTTDNFTVVMAKTDIGNTLPNVNRVWYVNEGTAGGSTATMNLFFTKQTTSQYGISQDEVESSFDYTNTLLAQKDYSGNFLNISSNPSTDKIDNSSNTLSTEVYAKYTVGVSKDVSGNTNGINNFNRFTILNSLSNDLCTNAVSVTVNGGTTGGDLTGATFSSPFSSGNDVWYTFTASCTGTHPITISSIASGTLGVQVFASTCPSSTTGISLASGSASGSSTFTGNYSLTSGTTYYVRVYTVSGTPSTFNIAVTSTGNLNLSNTGAPAAGYIYPNSTNNPISGFTVTPDACLTSYDLTSVKFTLSGLIITADINNFRLIYDADNSGTYNGGDVLVSASYALASPTLTVTITGETGLSGTRRYLLIADVPNTATVDHYLTYSVAAATDLVASATVVGTATCNQQIIGPANDLCGTPTALALNTTLSSQSMTNATITSPFAEKDMWYSFTPTCTGTYNITIGSIAAGTIGIQVFNTSCPSTTTSGLQTSTGGSTSGTSSFSGGYSLTSGTTYYIRVYAVSGSPTTFSITAANTVTINNTGAPAAANHLQGATNQSISGFTVVAGCTSSYTVNTVKFTTNGTATSSDFVASSFKIYKDVNANNTYDNGTDISVTATGQSFGATMTFTLSGSYTASQAFFLVCDITSSATAGHTITASIVDASTDVTLTSPIGVYGSATCNTQTIVGTLASDDYRTQSSGNWATASVWQSYNAGTGWITASAAPTSSANSITIQNGHTITIAAAATADELTIQSGGILNQSVGQTFTISNGPSAIDFNILSGGTFVVNGSVPTFSSSATMEVQSGGIVRVDGQTSTAGQNQSDVLAYSSASYPTVIFRTGSIYQWNVSNSVFAAGFTTAGVTYFPNATGEVPIFRVSAAQATKTPGTACVINGKYEHSSGISFGWAGSASKTFRDGFGGAGTITFFPGGGSNFITGTSAVIDGTVTISVNNSSAGVTNNLTVSSGGSVTVSGSPTINIGGTTAGSASGTANLTINSGATWTMSGTPNLNIGNQTSSGIANLNIGGTFTSTSSNPVRLDYFGTNTLNITGTIGAGNTATFTPNNAGLTNIANVTVNGSGSVGTLTFTSGFQTVKNFTLTAGSVTLGSNMTVNSTGTHTMTAGTLNMNGKTVTINGIISNSAGTYTGSTSSNLSIGGSGTITGNFNFTAGSQNLAALTMNRTGTTATIGTDLTLNSASTITAGTVANSSSTTLALNSSIANSGTLSIAGTLQMNTGSSVTGTAPTYGSSSTLLYNSTGTFTVGNEWTGNATTAGLGIPQNVTVQNTGTVSMPSTDRGLAGNLTISAGTLALNATSGNLYVAGKWTNNSAFTHNNRTVFFNGSAAQSINGTTAGSFYNLTDNNTTADVTMNQDVSVSNILSLNTSSVFAINGNTLTLGGTISGAGSLRGSSSSDLVMSGTGQVGTLRFASGGQTLNLISINRTGISNNYAALLASDLTVNALTLTNGIIATGNNLFTWTKTGSLLPVAQTTYTPNNTSYKNSYVCICDGTGTGLTITEPYDGTKGFRISNVGIDVWFPIGVDFNAPNRMWVDNSGPSPLGTSDNLTAAIKKGTWGGAYPKVDRIWYVKEGTTGGTYANMRLYFTKQDNTQFGISQDEVENGFDYTDIHLTQKNYNDNNFLDVSQSTDIQNGLSNTNGTELYADYNIGVSPDVSSATDGINYFSRFMVANAPAFILPVTIINLTATESAGTVKLNWTSVDEVNISHYEIERSPNASAFNYAGTVDAKNNGAIKTNYTFDDVQPFTGNNYYRLKIVEKDGKTYYSNIVMITIKGGKTFITVMPNPMPKNSNSSVRFNNVVKGEYHLMLYSNSGTILSSQIITHAGGTATYKLQLPAGIATGMYILKVNGTETSFTVKLVVE